VTASKPSQVFTVFIRTAPEQLWEALTSSDYTLKYAQVAGGMPFILSGLKTLLETGEPLSQG
jgi:hypothetical protein